MTMSSNLTTSLSTHFGFESFRAWQEGAIQSLLEKHHTLVVMPTGAGKSLIFQLATYCADKGASEYHRQTGHSRHIYQ